MSVKPTYSQTVFIGEHEYRKPPLPKSKKDILFYDNSADKAFWLRLELPDVFSNFIPNFTELYQESTEFDSKGLAKSFNKQDSDLFIETLTVELRRREHGAFFRNKNEIEYITGSHYFLLQHCRVFGKDARYKIFCKTFGTDVCDEDTYLRLYADYGNYFEYQRDFFYLVEKSTNDDECLGLYVSKAKKTGVSFLMSCYLLNRSTLYKQCVYGVMSKKQSDAIETNLMYYFFSFDSLPAIFKPNIQTLAKAQGEIVFGAKSFTGISAQKNALSHLMKDKALNSRVWTVVTKSKAYDSPRVGIACIDEFNKIWAESKISPKEIFETTAPTVKLQTTIMGKVFLLGYTSETNDQGVSEARKIYFDSKLKTKNGGSRTKSELWCYHISSLDSFLEHIDRYGKCNSKEANRKIEEALDRAKNDPKLYQSIQRQLARNEKDAWSVGSTTSTFNVKELSDHLTNLQQEISESPTNIGERFYLRWDNDLWERGKKDRRPKGKFCPVKRIVLTEQDILDGVPTKFTSFSKMHRDMENLALRYGVDDNGILLPPPRFSTITGVDPTNYAAGSEVVAGSKSCMISINFHDELLNSRLGHVATKIITTDYYCRTENPSESYEDMVKWIIYSGSLCLVEGNSSYMATRMIEEGLINYMIVRDKEKIMTLGKTWMKLGEDCNLIRRTANADQNDILETLVRVITHYIEVVHGEINYLALIKIIKLIEQLITFDPKDTRLFDYPMALGYCLLAYEIYYNSLFENNDDYNNLNNYAAVLNAFAMD